MDSLVERIDSLGARAKLVTEADGTSFALVKGGAKEVWGESDSNKGSTHISFFSFHYRVL